MSIWLDRLLGRVTMYRMVLIVLGVFWLVALVFGAVHLIPFGPLGLVESTAVALVLCYLSNRLFAALWRVRPHSESSLVTAMLAVFLFLPLPTLQAQEAVAIAVVAGSLSKYLLAWRGRHLFNPVAAGAVAVLLTRVSGATWWIATPVMLPLLVLGGALVLYRARSWDLGLPVIVVGVIGAAIRMASFGTPLGTAVWTAIASFPYLFLGAFMMSEPLTAPPRRWQRIGISAVVGGVSLLPLHLGFVAMTPEIALLVGNALAFGLGPRRRVRLRLIERRSWAGGIDELRFRPEAPLRLRPGQFVELSLPHRGQDTRGARRVFSVASAPSASMVRVITRHDERPSTFKRALLAHEPGQHLQASAVGGDFTVGDERRPQLWLAGGVGITPFLSAAAAHAAARRHVDAVLVWAVRPGDDFAWADELDAAGVRVLVVGPPELAAPGALPLAWDYAGARLSPQTLATHVPDARGRVAYAAGSPRIVSAARHAARANHVRSLRTDRFLGY